MFPRFQTITELHSNRNHAAVCLDLHSLFGLVQGFGKFFKLYTELVKEHLGNARALVNACSVLCSVTRQQLLPNVNDQLLGLFVLGNPVLWLKCARLAI